MSEKRYVFVSSLTVDESSPPRSWKVQREYKQRRTRTTIPTDILEDRSILLVKNDMEIPTAPKGSHW